MALFLATEVMLFAGLVSAFLVLRAGAVAWPPPGQPRLPVGVTGLNTLVLLASGAFMLAAVRAAAAGAMRRAARLLWVTLASGACFLLVQGSEWARLVAFGLTMRSGQYGAVFYTLIGCHALHVLAAVTALGVVAIRHSGRSAAAAPRGRAPTELRVMAMYWSFVVGIWPVLYVLVYLL